MLFLLQAENDRDQALNQPQERLLTEMDFTKNHELFPKVHATLMLSSIMRGT